jgi:hypothetical protein
MASLGKASTPQMLLISPLLCVLLSTPPSTPHILRLPTPPNAIIRSLRCLLRCQFNFICSQSERLQAWHAFPIVAFEGFGPHRHPMRPASGPRHVLVGLDRGSLSSLLSRRRSKNVMLVRSTWPRCRSVGRFLRPRSKHTSLSRLCTEITAVSPHLAGL